MATIPFECRAELSTLASLYKYYQSKGIFFNSRSNFIRTIVEDLYTVLLRAGGLEPVTTDEEAIKILASITGLTGKLNRRSVLDSISKERIEETVGFDSAVKSAIETFNTLPPKEDGESLES